MKPVVSPNGDVEFWKSLESVSGHHWVAQDFEGRGLFKFSGCLRFAGTWSGIIEGGDPEAHLMILQASRVQGVIRVAKISIQGTLTDVQIEADFVHLLPGSRVEGRISAARLVIDEGAVVMGSMRPAHQRRPSPALRNATL